MCTLRMQPRRGGYTLIELVVVLMVLAIVAGLTVAIVGWVRRSANYAAQGHSQSSLMANLELYRTTYGNNAYPDRFDSLILAGGDAIHTSAGYAHEGHATLYAKGSLTADERACLDFITTVMDHHATNKHAGLQGNVGNSATVSRAFTGADVAIVNTTSPTGTAAQLLAEIYPAGIPTGVKLVAFGIGPSNTALGRTMQSPPHDPRVAESDVYSRYIAIFAVYEPRGGRRAQLKAVVNAMGRTQNNALSEFWQSTAPE